MTAPNSGAAPELLPIAKCPYGCDWDKDPNENFRALERGSLFWGCCEVCGCQGPVASSKTEAVQFWNSRADLAAPVASLGVTAKEREFYEVLKRLHKVANRVAADFCPAENDPHYEDTATEFNAALDAAEELLFSVDGVTECQRTTVTACPPMSQKVTTIRWRDPKKEKPPRRGFYTVKVYGGEIKTSAFDGWSWETDVIAFALPTDITNTTEEKP